MHKNRETCYRQVYFDSRRLNQYVVIIYVKGANLQKFITNVIYDITSDTFSLHLLLVPVDS